jgi:hypothetical protein
LIATANPAEVYERAERPRIALCPHGQTSPLPIGAGVINP